MTRFLRLISLTVLIVSGASGLLQGQNQQYAFRVNFGDKNATTFTLSNPGAYLSQRSLDRRTKYNITIDSTDLPVVAAYVDSVLVRTNGILHTRSRWQNSCVILTSDSALITQVLDLSFVTGVKKVAYYSNGLHDRPQPSTSDTSGTGNRPTNFDAGFYAAAWEQINMCEGEYLHEEGFTGAGQLIAVIDVGFTGVNTANAFDSMFVNGRLMDTWNYIYDTADVFDAGDHGCAVLSCMASYKPETHVGTAPDAMYALYATDHASTEQAIELDNFVAATERADSIGADVINSSLGYSTFDNPDDSYTYADLDGHSTPVARAANAATRKGILVVVSAGNDGNTPWQHILTPGDADSALTVGSVNADKSASSFSGEGPNASGLLKPNVSTRGSGTAIINASGAATTTNGTSVATPILSGLAACLLQARPQLTPLELRSLIESVSHLHASPNNKSGHGIPNFRLAYNNETAIGDEIAPAQHKSFVLYPNPAKDELFVQPSSATGTHKQITLTIYDVQGRLLQQKLLSTSGRNAAASIDLRTLPTGLLFLRIQGGKSSQISKIVHQP